MPLQPFVRPRVSTPRRSSATQTHQAFAFPPPSRGLNTAQPLPGGDPLTALRLENMIPRALGVQMRKGYRRWSTNLVGGVISFINHRPADVTLTPPKLLAATSDGNLYDVTDATGLGDIPPLVATVGGAPSGEWTSLNFVTAAGVHVTCMVCPGAGYFVYDGTTLTEITVGVGVNQIDGVDPDVFVHVAVYQNQLWFVEGNSTRAWYLPVGVYFGAATAFNFGPMFPMGGALDLLINWTMDGSSGVGINSQLVVVSNQGDVLVYGGGPVIGDFRVVGRWNVGRVPVGRRYASMYMADVVLLSERGMCFLSELMRGDGFFQNPQFAQAVNSSLAALLSSALDTRYWEVKFVPQEQLIIINYAEINTDRIQLVYEVNNKAFATMRGIPMVTVGVFEGQTFTGDSSGNVWQIFTGESDGAIGNIPGADLQGTIVTAFQAMGDGVRVKRFQMVRPSFLSSVAPGVQATLNPEWNLGTPGSAPSYLTAGDLWDVGDWNVAIWSGGSSSYEAWIGCSGTGRYAALAMRVRGTSDIIFIAWTAVVEPGGIL